MVHEFDEENGDQHADNSPVEEVDSDPSTAGSEQPVGRAIDKQPAAKRRRRNSREVGEMIVDAIKEASSNMDQAMAEMGKESQMIARNLYLELMKVEGLTDDEINKAHVKLAGAELLMVGFPLVPMEKKASWIRNLIS